MQLKEILRFFFELGQLFRVKLASRYMSAESTTVVREQTKDLGEIGDRIFQLWHLNKELSSTAGRIAKDADLVELAVRAKEFMSLGVEGAAEWFDNASTGVKTESAKRLLDLLRSSTSTKWW